MSLFPVNLLLAVVWAMLTWAFTLGLLVVGFAALWVLRPLMGAPPGYFMRVLYWLRLIAMFHWELVVSSASVVWDVVTPRHRSRSAIVEVPLTVRSDAGVPLVTNLISLTPGTLTLDRRTLRVRAMFGEDPDAVRRQLTDGMERWVRDALEE